MTSSLGEPEGYLAHTEHRIDVAADPAQVYALIADVTRWPREFGPTVHAERLDFDGCTERIRLWATANGEPKTWVSRRELDADRSRIAFRQEVSQSPVAAMRGEWIVTARPGGSSVLLTHDYTPVPDVPDAAEWIAEAIERNSTAELAAVRDAVEGAAARAELTADFADSVDIEAPAGVVYGFLNEADAWPQRLPHVLRLDLTETTAGLQLMSMDTKAIDGSTHTTTSVRVCQPDSRIYYKQLQLPPLLDLHLGCWTITERPAGGVTVTSRHIIRILPDRVSLLGPDATVEQAKAYVRKALGANSLATLRHAKQFAEVGTRD